MMWQKKAVSIEFLVTFIILIVILLVVLELTYKITQTNEQASDVEQCRKSVELQGLTKIPGVETGIFNKQLDCPTIYRKINDPNEEVIKKRLAYDLSECWYKFSGGKEDIFQAIYKEQSYYCVVCSVTEFTGSSQNKEINGFSYYLANTPAPLRHTNGKQLTFLEFLQSYKQEDKPLFKSILENPEYQLEQIKEALDPKADILSTETPYATLLIYTNKGFNNIIESADTYATSGGLLGATVALIPKAGIIGKIIKTTKYVVAGYISGGVSGIYQADNDPSQWQAATVLIPYIPEELDKLSCNELPIKQDVRTQKFIKK